jgi:predicted nucleic acid-binding protein
VSASLLDTSVLVSLAPAVGSLPPTAAISVVTIGELHAGVLLARDAATRAQRGARFDRVRAAFAPLPIDEEVALRYGEILAVARREGRTEKATDVLIVATASAYDRTLHTRDERQAGLARAAGVDVELL